jgi:hypothetical protein
MKSLARRGSANDVDVTSLISVSNSRTFTSFFQNAEKPVRCQYECEKCSVKRRLFALVVCKTLHEIIKYVESMYGCRSEGNDHRRNRRRYFRAYFGRVENLIIH